MWVDTGMRLLLQYPDVERASARRSRSTMMQTKLAAVLDPRKATTRMPRPTQGSAPRSFAYGEVVVGTSYVMMGLFPEHDDVSV